MFAGSFSLNTEGVLIVFVLLVPINYFSGSLPNGIDMSALLLPLCFYVDVGGRTPNLQKSCVNFFIFYELAFLSRHWMG